MVYHPINGRTLQSDGCSPDVPRCRARHLVSGQALVERRQLADRVRGT